MKVHPNENNKLCQTHKITNIYLQCMKALSRNDVTATLLGREGVVAVICDIMTKLSSTSFGPKLKVAAEVISALTKSSKFYFGYTHHGISLGKWAF